MASRRSSLRGPSPDARARNDPLTEPIVIRRGKTEWNGPHRFLGQIDLPLNEIGQRQAEPWGRWTRHDADLALSWGRQRRAVKVFELVQWSPSTLSSITARPRKP